MQITVPEIGTWEHYDSTQASGKQLCVGSHVLIAWGQNTEKISGETEHFIVIGHVMVAWLTDPK